MRGHPVFGHGEGQGVQIGIERLQAAGHRLIFRGCRPASKSDGRIIGGNTDIADHALAPLGLRGLLSGHAFVVAFAGGSGQAGAQFVACGLRGIIATALIALGVVAVDDPNGFVRGRRLLAGTGLGHEGRGAIRR